MSVAQPQPTRPSTKRIVLVCSILAVAFVGISYLHWKDMSTDLPAFEGLRVVEANSMRSDLRPDVEPRRSRAIEFFAQDGLRYQVPSLEPPDLALVNQGIREGTPVRLRYGEWDAATESDKIFTVYQLEVGDRVVMPYSRAVESKEHEKEGRVPVLVVSALVSAFAIFLGIRRNFPRRPSTAQRWR
jgi:hypothetical protein